MNLPYLNEFITNNNNIKCQVLDVSNIDFSNASIGRKITETLVLKAKGGEKINTINKDGFIEATYIAKENDTIFCNDETDIYVPRNKDGTSWCFDNIEEYGYEITTNIVEYKGYQAIKVKSTKTAYLLPRIIKIPSCIKDAWGEGQHQFLNVSSTLKQDPITKKVTGIDNDAFDTTWEITKTIKKNR